VDIQAFGTLQRLLYGAAAGKELIIAKARANVGETFALGLRKQLPVEGSS